MCVLGEGEGVWWQVNSFLSESAIVHEGMYSWFHHHAIGQDSRSSQANTTQKCKEKKKQSVADGQTGRQTD